MWNVYVCVCAVIALQCALNENNVKLLSVLCELSELLLFLLAHFVCIYIWCWRYRYFSTIVNFFWGYGSDDDDDDDDDGDGGVNNINIDITFLKQRDKTIEVECQR